MLNVWSAAEAGAKAAGYWSVIGRLPRANRCKIPRRIMRWCAFYNPRLRSTARLASGSARIARVLRV